MNRFLTVMVIGLLTGACGGGGSSGGTNNEDTPPAPAGDADGDGFTIAAGDCNDEDANINPDATDGLFVDRNCDGKAGGSLAAAEYTFVGENAEDYAGYWVSSAGDVDGDGLGDVLAGAYDNDGSSPGAAYLILGASLSAHGTFDIGMADYKFVGEDPGDWAGFVVSSANLDGDGLTDILVSAYGVDDKGPITGAAYVVLARNLGSSSTIELSQADYKFIGESADDYAGYALSNAGDIDGDGLDDILIGASGQDTGGTNAGAGYLILASSLGASRTIDLSLADYKFVGEAEDGWAGYSISDAGDVDGDGLDDLILGADVDDGGDQAHASYLILGGSLGTNQLIDLAQADYKFIGESAFDYASQVSSAGDVDGDGLDDILIGAAGSDVGGSLSGQAYVVLGKNLGASQMFDLSQADYKLTGENAGDYAGATVADAGDIDGDGLGDILIGALHYQAQYSDQGAAYIVLGKSLSTESVVDLSDADIRLTGESANQFAGVAVASAGDVNGDGLDDVVLGAYGGAPWKGTVHIVTGE